MATATQDIRKNELVKEIGNGFALTNPAGRSQDYTRLQVDGKTVAMLIARKSYVIVEPKGPPMGGKRTKVETPAQAKKVRANISRVAAELRSQGGEGEGRSEVA